MAVSHDGGIFRTKTLAENSQDFKSLAEINQQVLSKFGIVHGATHSEFIKSNEDGKFYFLETSSRVGGAHIPDMVEASTNINLWREWAKLKRMFSIRTNMILVMREIIFPGSSSLWQNTNILTLTISKERNL